MNTRLDAAQTILPILLLGAVWIALVFDLRQHRIPNALTFGAAAMGVAAHFMLGGTTGLVTAVTGLAVGLVILLPGYLLRTTGAGDVKLMAAAGTFLGPFWALVAGLTSILVGGLIALAFAASTLLSRTSPAPWSRYALMLKTLARTGRVAYVAPAAGEVMGRKFPYAVSIAVGTSLTLVIGWPALSAQWAG